MEEAASLAEHLLHDYHAFLKGGLLLMPGTGGIFTVTLNDEVLYTNEGSGYFPTREEIDQALEQRLGLAGDTILS